MVDWKGWPSSFRIVLIKETTNGETMTRGNVTGNNETTQDALIDSEDFIRDIVHDALQQFLEAEMTEFLGAEPYERSDERTGVRNGYKPRTLKLKVGTIVLSVPQTRDGSFSTELFGRFQRSEKAFTLAIMEMYVDGVSTRKVSDITERLCGTSFSRSTVSGLCSSLDEQIALWKANDLSAHTYPYVFVDAIYKNVRKAARVVSEGMLVVTAIRDDGKREILDAVVADTESAGAYEELFSSLKGRGLSGVMLVTSDAHIGLKQAVCRYFQGAAWQRCQVHFVRDCMGRVSLRYRAEIAADINAVFRETTRETAMRKAIEVADKWKVRCEKVAEMIEEDIEQCLSNLAFPEKHRKRIRTNNSIERFNEELRRRTRVIRIFPNERAMLRLVATLCIEQSEAWVSGRQYLDMSPLDMPASATGIELVGKVKVEKTREAS
jgi:putative transposase